jgi:hypothetical protein
LVYFIDSKISLVARKSGSELKLDNGSGCLSQKLNISLAGPDGEDVFPGINIFLSVKLCNAPTALPFE